MILKANLKPVNSGEALSKIVKEVGVKRGAIMRRLNGAEMCTSAPSPSASKRPSNDNQGCLPVRQPFFYPCVKKCGERQRSV